jgi:hypothetical protein
MRLIERNRGRILVNLVGEGIHRQKGFRYL